MKPIIFVPARAGSFGIKNKNLTITNGKPLIYYTLKICKKLNDKYEIFISTDSTKIANYCESLGFKTKYRRPKKFSNSTSNVVDAVIDGTKWLKNKFNKDFSHVILLQPTSPLRKIKDIKKAIHLFKSKNLESLASVSKVKEHSHTHIKSLNKILSSKWKYVQKREKNIFRRQQLEKDHFLLNGSIYIASLGFLKKNRKFIVERKTYLFEISKILAIDVDYPEDLLLAESILKNNQIKI